MLARLEPGGMLPGEVAEAHGIAVYIFSARHVSRANGFFSTMMWAGGKHPHYQLNDEGMLRSLGPFAESRPLWTRTMIALSHSSLLRAFNVEIPFLASDKHLDLTCALILESSRRYEAMHPKNRFLVFLDNELPTKHPMRERCFKSPAFEIVDLTEQKGWEMPKMVLPSDGHLNAKGARFVAEAIAAYLKKPR